MTTFVILIHVVVCFALIMIVLLQTGKGADMGAAFGAGSSQTLFGSAGPGGFLTKATTAAAIVFMLTSLGLAYLSGPGRSSSIIKEIPKAEQPAELPAAAPAAPAAEATEAPAAEAPAAPADEAAAAPAAEAPAPEAPAADAGGTEG